jgi:TRAP-type C4-dicarboxylate transport system substrate-binding protein
VGAVRIRRHSATRGALATGIAVVAAAASGCGTTTSQTPNKAAAPHGPTVLRLAVSDNALQPESPRAREFAARVKALSHGKLRVHVAFLAAGDRTPDVEERTASLVRSGRFDLGWIATRAWDELGLTSFQALQAPFLVTSYPLAQRIAKGPLAREMLASLERRDLVGLALIPGLLRHPVGLGRPLVSTADFAGARVRDQPSKASDALLRALRAVPVHVSNRDVVGETARGRLDAEELSLVNAPIGGVVTANVTFFPKVSTLFASKRAWGRLGSDERRILRRAATRTLHHWTSFPVRPALAFEGTLARQVCARGIVHLALASDEQRAALVRAARPVYTQLERDPETRRLISRIRTLKASLPPEPPVVVPPRCSAPPASVAGSAAAASALNGTYHRLLTAAAARRHGFENAHDTVITEILQDGRWWADSSDPPSTGAYAVRGDRLVFGFGTSVLRFRLARDGDGTLHLTPIPPMDKGDAWITAGAPWRRVGPPIRNLG